LLSKNDKIEMKIMGLSRGKIPLEYLVGRQDRISWKGIFLYFLTNI